MSSINSNNLVPCPVCNSEFSKDVIESHVNKCIFLSESQNDSNSNNFKRNSPFESESKSSPRLKRVKITENKSSSSSTQFGNHSKLKYNDNRNVLNKSNVPLAELMRPIILEDIVGHKELFGNGSLLQSMLSNKKIPNMILWGPPGCGKTSIANVIANICKEQESLRFVKLSAVMVGINDVKEVIKAAKNELQFKRHTVLFMDEIHRFNKLQQDTFLPHVENGTISLVGATTENPSFSLNNALLSRCKVIVLQKLSTNDVTKILEKAIAQNEKAVIVDDLNGEAVNDMGEDFSKGEEHYNIISAIQKSIRASDDNAALYWTTRALHAGEDPLYIARRLIRTSCEDIGLGDPNAVVEAVACLQGCQHIGMPECDVLLAQCAVRLARAPKSTEVYHAMKNVQRTLNNSRGPLPSVPLHLCNAPTKLMKELGYGKGYNTQHKNESGLTYMPQGLENTNFFNVHDNGD
ncbi:unnamed protein product [Leptidea sinapis]|uniref:UBZ4-type domain-containing protein n=1 Tax=Leptidea sinapis TaxID=189913 RepID=A0A5E4QVG3_9NEOP|nr:unnamed protein product [Leptidea sinapis]